MLSLVLYGRNDNYGYNLHKRAALSLNCMAEVLTHPDDEILFVDYNTPDDYPTFPEAIADTLTTKAKALLRIFRVRPEIHRQRFAAKTHLKALEPVARNVAIRRSNQRNRWILSTNTDMIFVPRTDRSLSEVAESLADGIYCAPRIELPETLWEGFDRLDPVGVIEETARCGRELHLNEIVLGADTIRYDAPGDFQLMTRDDLFAYQAFHEGMLLGWHLDSNISKRLSLVYGEVGDAAPFVLGYHCDHTRQVTPMHAHRSPENSISQYVDYVTDPSLPTQANSWGLMDAVVEEYSLERSNNIAYLRVLKNEISSPLGTPLEATYRAETFGLNTGSPEHVLPFLVDMFVNFERSDDIVWVGQTGKLFDMFSASWKQLGFTGAVRAGDSGPDFEAAAERATAYVLNFGLPSLLEPGDEQDSILRAFLALITLERRRVRSGLSPRRFVCINTIHNRFEDTILRWIGAGRTPFSTRMRHGFLLADVTDPDGTMAKKDWTRDMRVGPQGIKVNGAIRSVDEPGCVAFGPYACLLADTYEIEMLADVRSFDEAEQNHLLVEIVLAEAVQSTTPVTFAAAGRTLIRVPLLVRELDFVKLIQVRVFRHQNAVFDILSVAVAPKRDSTAQAPQAPMLAEISPPARGFIAKLLSVFQKAKPLERSMDA